MIHDYSQESSPSSPGAADAVGAGTEVSTDALDEATVTGEDTATELRLAVEVPMYEVEKLLVAAVVREVAIATAEEVATAWAEELTRVAETVATEAAAEVETVLLLLWRAETTP